MGADELQYVSALAALVQRVVDESGDPAGFDALAWTRQWINEPVPALGGACPAELMGTAEGRAVVETLVMRMQSGSYS
ncbi:MbcA/ParS/Xre antitoxin family protein [uncultured Piscinibacter sp.]|uniref:MbcA/ParS/Xre antitoxin family protein n=1 Tax=uncultured Piscinibacter sp. TaxID=1131835 RepID=UPI00261DF51E|nr:MbcA/ParS/Xre antitoxin family protein [uncultured Piscinibacter sp.]